MTTVTTQPDLDQSQLDYYDALHDQHDDDYSGGDLLTSVAFDLNKHRRSIESLEQASCAYCDEILTMKAHLHQLAATIEDLQTHETFSVPDDELF